MEITDIRIRTTESNDKKLKAFVSVVFDEVFVVHNLKIIEGNKGVFVAMPSKKTPKGEYEDLAHPVRKDFRDKLQTAILEKYGRTIKNGGA